MNIGKRLTSATPSFFSKLRNIGIIAAAIGGALATVPIALPDIVTQIAGYLIAAGAAMGTVSQAVVQDPDTPEKP